MEASCSSETLVNVQRTTRRYIQEDRTLHNYLCENLKSYLIRIDQRHIRQNQNNNNNNNNSVLFYIMYVPSRPITDTAQCIYW
jgi:hypothetical protein